MLQLVKEDYGMNSLERSKENVNTGSPWDALKGLSFDESEEPETKPERLSKKPIDIFVRKIFESNPELENLTTEMLGTYTAQDRKLPFLHITPDAIKYKDGTTASTGNVKILSRMDFCLEIQTLGVSWRLEKGMIR